MAIQPSVRTPAAVGMSTLTALLLLLVGVALLVDRTPSGAASGVVGIPAAYVPVYRFAAEAYGVPWLVVAAIHAQESDFSRLRPGGINGNAVSSGWNGCGAAGPMQFGIVDVSPYNGTAPSCGALTGTGAGNTWLRYRDAFRRLPKNVRPRRYPQMRARLPSCAKVPKRHGCVYDDVDAIAAAAAYLHDLGAGRRLDDRAWHAARRYNGAAAYADAVLARARAWEAELANDLTLTEPATTPGALARLGADGLARAPANAPRAVSA
jgi:hypothetical protein